MTRPRFILPLPSYGLRSFAKADRNVTVFVFFFSFFFSIFRQVHLYLPFQIRFPNSGRKVLAIIPVRQIWRVMEKSSLLDKISIYSGRHPSTNWVRKGSLPSINSLFLHKGQSSYAVNYSPLYSSVQWSIAPCLLSVKLIIIDSRFETFLFCCYHFKALYVVQNINGDVAQLKKKQSN